MSIGTIETLYRTPKRWAILHGLLLSIRMPLAVGGERQLSQQNGDDLSYLREWIGRGERARDLVTPRVVECLLATLDRRATGLDAQVPATIHWCLATPNAPMSEIGKDGHPQREGFLPPVSLPRRIWAGGALEYLDQLRVGDEIERVSTVADVAVERGNSGTLCFVLVDHVISTPMGVAIHECQDIVYRDDAPRRSHTRRRSPRNLRPRNGVAS